MVSNRNLGWGNFRLLPPGGEMSKNVRKIALFETVDDFSNREKFKKSKTNLSRPDISPSNPLKFFQKISSSFWDWRYPLETSDVKKNGRFRIWKARMRQNFTGFKWNCKLKLGWPRNADMRNFRPRPLPFATRGWESLNFDATWWGQLTSVFAQVANLSLDSQGVSTCQILGPAHFRFGR